MVHFFGILHPGKLARHVAGEAPAKAPIFGGLPDFTLGSIPMSRLEQDACYLQGRAPEPEQSPDDGDRAGINRPTR